MSSDLPRRLGERDKSIRDSVSLGRAKQSIVVHVSMSEETGNGSRENDENERYLQYTEINQSQY